MYPLLIFLNLAFWHNRDVSFFYPVQFQDTAIIYVYAPETKVSSVDYVDKLITIRNLRPYHESDRGSPFNTLRFQAVDFTKSKFNADADFRYSCFSDNATFTEAKFCGPVSFLGATFKKINNFTRVEFKQSASFNFLILGDSTLFKFYQASLPDFMDFTRIDRIPNAIDLTRARFNSSTRYTAERRWHYINLCYSEPGKINIDYSHFRLCFYNDFYQTDDTFEIVKANNSISVRVNGVEKDTASLIYDYTFRKYMEGIFPQTAQPTNRNSFWATLSPYFFLSRWLRKPDEIFRVFVKESLSKNGFPKALEKGEMATFYNRQLKNFEDEGDRDSYKELDIEYQTATGSSWSRIWNCFGYHKEWVLWWTVIFLTIFTAITTIVLKALLKIYPFDHLNVEVNRQISFPMRIYYSFILTTSIFFALSLKFEKLKLVNLCVVYFFLVYLVGVLCMGYLAAFILQR